MLQLWAGIGQVDRPLSRVWTMEHLQ
ncbi:MAG: hypothetical protein SOW79_09460, partial [Prevotella sp.]|nr:hypothetical protein [Prevotella sp.]